MTKKDSKIRRRQRVDQEQSQFQETEQSGPEFQASAIKINWATRPGAALRREKERERNRGEQYE